jgi:SAM-dependent methyltransferase
MTPLTSLEQIFQVAFGFMASKALFAALHLGVFNALASGPKGLAAIADAIGADERALETLLTALTAVGLLERGEQGWTNAPATQMFLAPAGGGGLGEYLRWQVDRQMYPFMHELADVLRGRRDTVPYRDYESWFRDPAQAALYSEAQHEASLGLGEVLAVRLDLSGRRRLLDVGGGSGALAIALCRHNAELQATILDFPNVLEIARRCVAKVGLESRIELMPGNALASNWPGGQDVVLFSYVSGSVSAEGVAELYRRAFAALEPGGVALVHDFMVDDDRTGPPLAAIWALQHLTFTPGAVSLTPGFVTGLLRDAGFCDTSVEDCVPGMTRLVRAAKPL